jgi:uncharacterized protein
MPYIIDGHNLIGKLPNIHLDDPDDEKQLIEMLIPFCVENNKKADIYFDNAPLGQSGAKVHGRVIARYVRSGETADQAIKRRLSKLGADAASWTVVTSDREVQTAAKRSYAKVVTSEDFANRLMADPKIVDKGKSEDPKISNSEIDEWMDLFGGEE